MAFLKRDDEPAGLIASCLMFLKANVVGSALLNNPRRAYIEPNFVINNHVTFSHVLLYI